MKINYVTGNKDKLTFAQKMLSQYGIEVIQKNIEVPEIQDSDYKKISLEKVNHAYGILQEPLFITDAAWEIPALNGFPGAFMKYVNKWFTPQDWLNLINHKSNRSIHVLDSIEYQDKDGVKRFEWKQVGEIATKTFPTGKNGLHQVVKFDGKYIAEYSENHDKIRGEEEVWREFAEFLKSRNI